MTTSEDNCPLHDAEAPWATIVAWLDTVRDQRNLSGGDLRRAVGFPSSSTFFSIRAGKRNLLAKECSPLGEALGLSASDTRLLALHAQAERQRRSTRTRASDSGSETLARAPIAEALALAPAAATRVEVRANTPESATYTTRARAAVHRARERDDALRRGEPRPEPDVRLGGAIHPTTVEGLRGLMRRLDSVAASIHAREDPDGVPYTVQLEAFALTQPVFDIPDGPARPTRNAELAPCIYDTPSILSFALQWREHKRWSHTRLAQVLGCDRSTLYRAERSGRLAPARCEALRDHLIRLNELASEDVQYFDRLCALEHTPDGEVAEQVRAELATLRFAQERHNSSRFDSWYLENPALIVLLEMFVLADATGDESWLETAMAPALRGQDLGALRDLAITNKRARQRPDGTVSVTPLPTVYDTSAAAPPDRAVAGYHREQQLLVEKLLQSDATVGRFLEFQVHLPKGDFATLRQFAGVQKRAASILSEVRGQPEIVAGFNFRMSPN